VRLLIEQDGARAPASPSSGDIDTEPTDERQEADEEDEASAIVSAGMVTAIRFYKFWISPLLPPACRFVPTCSIYGMQAIREFGPYKGAVLTAWRILRCSPFGGKGYDPPRWPPVFYTYSSY
jgi:putative membrane protein insertion efficiency factor